MKHRWERKSLCWQSTQILTAAEPIPRTLLQMSTQRTWKTLVNGFKKHSERESHLTGCLKENEKPYKDREGNKPTEQIVLEAHDNLSSHTSQLPIRCFPISPREDTNIALHLHGKGNLTKEFTAKALPEQRAPDQ